ncbi:MAG: hypothetical protein AAGM38_12255, partial [Pseudomonadota bacterium]
MANDLINTDLTLQNAIEETLDQAPAGPALLDQAVSTTLDNGEAATGLELVNDVIEQTFAFAETPVSVPGGEGLPGQFVNVSGENGDPGAALADDPSLGGFNRFGLPISIYGDGTEPLADGESEDTVFGGQSGDHITSQLLPVPVERDPDANESTLIEFRPGADYIKINADLGGLSLTYLQPGFISGSRINAATQRFLEENPQASAADIANFIEQNEVKPEISADISHPAFERITSAVTNGTMTISAARRELINAGMSPSEADAAASLLGIAVGMGSTVLPIDGATANPRLKYRVVAFITDPSVIVEDPAAIIRQAQEDLNRTGRLENNVRGVRFMYKPIIEYKVGGMSMALSMDLNGKPFVEFQSLVTNLTPTIKSPLTGLDVVANVKYAIQFPIRINRTEGDVSQIQIGESVIPIDGDAANRLLNFAGALLDTDRDVTDPIEAPENNELSLSTYLWNQYSRAENAIFGNLIPDAKELIEGARTLSVPSENAYLEYADRTARLGAAIEDVEAQKDRGILVKGDDGVWRYNYSEDRGSLLEQISDFEESDGRSVSPGSIRLIELAERNGVEPQVIMAAYFNGQYRARFDYDEIEPDDRLTLLAVQAAPQSAADVSVETLQRDFGLQETTAISVYNRFLDLVAGGKSPSDAYNEIQYGVILPALGNAQLEDPETTIRQVVNAQRSGGDPSEPEEEYDPSSIHLEADYGGVIYEQTLFEEFDVSPREINEDVANVLLHNAILLAPGETNLDKIAFVRGLVLEDPYQLTGVTGFLAERSSTVSPEGEPITRDYFLQRGLRHDAATRAVDLYENLLLSGYSPEESLQIVTRGIYEGLSAGGNTGVFIRLEEIDLERNDTGPRDEIFERPNRIPRFLEDYGIHTTSDLIEELAGYSFIDADFSLTYDLGVGEQQNAKD